MLTNKLSSLKLRFITATVGSIFLFFILPSKSLTRLLILFIFSYIALVEWPPLVKNLSKFGKYFWTLVFLILPAAALFTLNEQSNRLWGLFLMLIVFIHDSAAYFAGSLWGKHKIAPNISPKKSWEGCLAGVLIVSLLLFSTNCFSLEKSIYLGIFISAMATTGDMCESYIKRRSNVKDSGTLLPGHGGLLDRFDAIFFLAPWWYLLQPNICNFS